MNDLSKPRVLWLEVGEEAAGQRIDNFLLRNLKGVPKSHVYRVLRSGEVRVNSGRVRPEYRLRVGDRVRVPPVRTSQKPSRPGPRPLRLPIVLEDAALLVVDKPSGVAVHGGSGVSHGVIESLRAERPQERFLELAHRLDRDTSGLLVLARKRSALTELHRMLREGEVDKRYLAVVKGRWPRRRTLVEAPLHKYVTGAGERRVAVHVGGQAARTEVRLLRASEAFSLLELRLLTGRTHQIRVHLAHSGHPVVGDEKYGDFELNRSLARQGSEGIKRLCLHAERLSFRHPVTGKVLKLASPLPEDIDRFLRAQLGPSGMEAVQ